MIHLSAHTNPRNSEYVYLLDMAIYTNNELIAIKWSNMTELSSFIK